MCFDHSTGRQAGFMVATLVCFALVLSSTASTPALGQATVDDYKKCRSLFGDIDTGIFSCSRVIADATFPPSIHRNALLRRGSLFYLQKDYDAAIADYSEMLRRNPRDVMALSERGGALMEKKDFDGAFKDYTTCIELDPSDGWHYNGRGQVHYLRGDYDLALADHMQAVRLRPKWGEMYFGRGQAYEALGKFNEALADDRQSLRVEHHPYIWSKKAVAKALERLKSVQR